MENEVKSFKEIISENIKTWRFWKPVVSFAAGGLLGFLYYFFIGCSSGNCGITGSPLGSTIWGGLMGLFIVNSPCARGRC